MTPTHTLRILVLGINPTHTYKPLKIER